jgi:TatD DNase family protein
MLIDTHCHINMMVKKEFDRALTDAEIDAAHIIIDEAATVGVSTIINVGTNLVESLNCIRLAQKYPHVSAAIGIHPNDCTPTWKEEYKELALLAKKKLEHNIVAIGECGLDFHYPDYNVQRQKDAFKAQIELALENDLALIVHTRQAPDETLRSLEEFKGQITRGVIHCFSEDQSFAQEAIALGYVLGIGGTLTYPKNNELRTIFKTIDVQHIILETDAPFLPPQSMRGKQNHPKNIALIAQFLSELREESYESIATHTTLNAQRVFNCALPS